ncbi:MAG TPA: hypothetical protein VEX68_01995 [Bryobacteraceae bacterium]|nr:hypothetical protein [Bryobacteraceae bacterium]
MLIEYEVAYGGSRVKISQRICPCSGSNGTVPPQSTGTLSRSLGASYFEALGGSGMESTGTDGGSGMESTGTDGGSGMESTGTDGGSGVESTETGGFVRSPKPVVIFGPIVTWE